MSDTITMVCPGCGKRVETPRDETDHPDAAELHGIQCPDCDTGGFDMPVFLNSDGEELCGDPEQWRHR